MSASGTPSGLELGLRFGYAVPLGDLAKDARTGTVGEPVSDAFSGGIPIILDIGYRLNPNIYLGAYGQYAFLFVNTDKSPECNASGVSCSGHDIRVGANLHYHISPLETVDPWIGLGIGYEWLTLSESAAGADVSVTFEGIEFLNLQLGGDVEAGPGFAVGPFVDFSLGQFSSASASGQGQTFSGDISNKAIHEWLIFGVRGVYKL